MAWRRIVLFCLLLVVIAAVANATVPRGDQRTVVRTPAAEPNPSGPTADIVNARLPSERDIEAKVGNIVSLEVSHDAQDVVQVASLGVSEPVERGIDAKLVFDADRAGRFAVTLRDAGTRIGTLEITQDG